jgi:hypothetical protein
MAVTLINNVARYTGDSNDTKPTTGLNVNDLFLELDTGDMYYWDGSDWVKVGGSE